MTARLAPMLSSAPLALAAAGLLGAAPARADDAQVWGSVSVTVAAGGNWKVLGDTVVRASDSRGLYDIVSALMVGHKVARNVTLWAGYGHSMGYTHGHLTAIEHRAREQVNVDNLAALGPVRLSGRVRLEQRWRENAVGTGWRLRPYLRASLPIAGKTALNLSNETFINLGRTSFQRADGIERMRTALTISTPIARHLTLEAGYLNQHGFVLRGPDTDDHIGTLALAASF